MTRAELIAAPHSPRTIQFAGRRVWGHDYQITKVHDKGQKLEIAGWHPGRIEMGDYLILENGKDETRYQVDSIQWFGNVDDMFAATVSFAPRQAQESANG